MLELLQNYTVAEIISFIILLSLAIKAIISFLDWAKERLFKFFRKEEKGNSLDDTLSKIIESQEQLSKEIKKINDTIEILIHSDKDDIKSFITNTIYLFINQSTLLNNNMILFCWNFNLGAILNKF